ncbi:unnamed protein product [Citrullus colocynthis]|uniref:Uncharacterized protein n=1 Tax=Citrullus colocynthis TaxID=252529 RepID=A0ABP0Z7T2_9ROSI
MTAASLIFAAKTLWIFSLLKKCLFQVMQMAVCLSLKRSLLEYRVHQYSKNLHSTKLVDLESGFHYKDLTVSTFKPVGSIIHSKGLTTPLCTNWWLEYRFLGSELPTFKLSFVSTPCY